MNSGCSTFELFQRLPLAFRRRAFPWRKIVSTPLVMAAAGREIHLMKSGSIANLTIRPQKMPPPAPTFLEATINVQTVGLNFRDVLNVLGLDPTGTVRPIGGEMAGIISTVGLACGHVLPSERAYGLAPGSLRSRAWCDARYIRCVARTLRGDCLAFMLHTVVFADSRALAQWFAANACL